MKIIESPVVFHNEGEQIIGMLHQPNSRNKPPAVVFFHGCTGSKVESHWLFVKLARALAELGIMVLRFDFRHSGDSEGNFEDMTVSGEISDGLKSIEYIVSTCGADPERIGILGISLGGVVAAAVAGTLGSRIKSCILMNPVGRPVEDLSAIASINHVSVDAFPIEYNSFLFGWNFYNDLKNITPLEDIKKAECPILVINGSSDMSVNPVRSKEYVEAVKACGGTAELYVVDGADHVFASVKWEREVTAKVCGWFGAALSVSDNISHTT